MSTLGLVMVLLLPAVEIPQLRPHRVLRSNDHRLVSPVRFSTTGKLLFCGHNSFVAVWDTATWKPRHRIASDWGRLFAASESGQLVATRKQDAPFVANEKLIICNIKEGKELPFLSGHTGDIRYFLFSDDEMLLLSVGDDGKIHQFRVNDGKELQAVPAHARRIAYIAASPDRKILATCAEDTTIKLWNATSLNEIGTLKGPIWPAGCMVFSPDSRLLAAWRSECSEVILWDVEKKAKLGEIIKPKFPSWFSGFSPDAKTVIVNHDSYIGIWDLQNMKERRTLQGHKQSIIGKALSLDGRLLVSSSEDHDVRLWDINSGQQLAILSTPAVNVRSIAFSPDGLTIAAGTEKGDVLIWSLEKGLFFKDK